MWLDCCDISHCFHVIKRWLEIYFCLIFPFFSNYIPYGYKSSGRAQQRRLANLCFLLRFHCSSSPQLRYLGSNKILNLFLSAAIFPICNICNIWNIFNWQYFQFAIFEIFEIFSIGNIFNLQYLQCLKGVKPLPSVVFLSALTLSFLTVNQETSIWSLYREVLQKQKTEFRMLYPLSNELTCVCNVLSAPPILEVFRKIYPNLWI